MVQKVHPRGVTRDPNFAPYVERFQILKLLSECSILEPSLCKLTDPNFEYKLAEGSNKLENN